MASWYWLGFNARFNNYALFVRTQANLVTLEAVLARMRAGKSEEATRMMETLLDGDLITAGVLLRDGYKFNDNARRAAETERRERKASGYEPADTAVSETVNETLRLLATEGNRGGSQSVEQ